MTAKYIGTGAVYALLAVAFGAFGAHALEEQLSESMLATYETGVRYQMYHALGLILIGLLGDKAAGQQALAWAARLLHIGILVFSGSLYVLTLTGFSKLGMITPIGGVAFIAGWVMLIVAVTRSK
ncbi:DUF423 domain-containing protein [Paenibacillus sp. 1P07SE]|uniref:DUF423 domain-containing protein n=1 Tax=Paenibacillus sp. 1P07SE TaxID=3132209 RepID=UPI0039A41266